MMKPVSAKQFLMLGLCFLGFAIAQAAFVRATFVQSCESQAHEIRDKYDCGGAGGGMAKPGTRLAGDDVTCQKIGLLLDQARDAEIVSATFAFGGGFSGLLMLGMAALKSRQHRKPAASAAA